MKEAITLKGKDGTIIVSIDESVDELGVVDEIREKFATAQTFFEGSMLQVAFEGKKLKKSVYADVINAISDDLNVQFFMRNVSGEPEIKQTSTIEENYNYTLFHKKTLRSGQFIESVGNIVIVGDVNPAAEVRAVGNVLVLGSVKGIVHAGCTGNREAFVFGLSLAPTQLRIANIISRAPDGKNEVYNRPEIAHIKENKILIEKYEKFQ